MTISNIDDFVSAKYSTYIVPMFYPTNSTPFLMLVNVSTTQPRPNFPDSLFLGNWQYTQFPVSTGTSRTGIRISGYNTGFMRIPDPEPGKNKYLCGIAGHTMSLPFMLVDVLMYITGMPITTTGGWVDINSTYLPSRDATGGSDGYGVRAALVCEGQHNVDFSTGAIVLQYTNSDGVGRRTGFIYEPKHARTLTSACFPFILQPDDKGVRSIQSIRLNTGQSSNIPGGSRYSLIMYRELCEPSSSSSNAPLISDINTNGLVEIYSGTSLINILNRNANSNAIMANVILKFVEK